MFPAMITVALAFAAMPLTLLASQPSDPIVRNWAVWLARALGCVAACLLIGGGDARRATRGGDWVCFSPDGAGRPCSYNRLDGLRDRCLLAYRRAGAAYPSGVVAGPRLLPRSKHQWPGLLFVYGDHRALLNGGGVQAHGLDPGSLACMGARDALPRHLPGQGPPDTDSLPMNARGAALYLLLDRITHTGTWRSLAPGGSPRPPPPRR